MALVGGGKSPRYSPNKVMIWDDHLSRCIGELSFRTEVRAVRLRRDRIIVVLQFRIYVYNFADLKLLHQIETWSNTKGICALSPSPKTCVLACPGQRKGEVRVELYTSKKTRFIMAHDSSLACLSLSLDGSLLATASNKGTLVRIFNTADGTKLQEVCDVLPLPVGNILEFIPIFLWFINRTIIYDFGLPVYVLASISELDASAQILGTFITCIFDVSFFA